MKKVIAMFLLSMFVVSLVNLNFITQEAFAAGYRSEIRIGLKNMASSTVDITLDGKYSDGSLTYSLGTSYKLTVKNGGVFFNGKEYESLTLTPEDRENLMKIRITYSFNGSNLAKEYSYRGAMDFKVVGGEILPVNTVNVEDYLMGVVPYEMSNSFHLEALKAQAVAARNYALANLGRHSSEGFDLDDTTHCQVYRGYNPYYKSSIRAVEETAGILLMHNGKLVNAYFSASDGGYTEACENVWMQTIPYLKAKPDIYDNDDGYNWTINFTNGEVEQKLRDRGYIGNTDKFLRFDIEGMKTYESGRVSKLDIIYQTSAGEQKIRTLSKEPARIFLSLNSAMYTLSYNNGSYTFKGRGNGHGIGMSQIGALYRARAGQSFEEILSFYYDGAYIEAPKAAVKSLQIDKNEILSGGSVKLSVEADSALEALFKFVVKKDDKAVYTGEFKADKELSFKPEAQGEYLVEAYVKGKGSKNDYDDLRSLKFNVFNPPIVKEITVEPGKIYIDKPFVVKAVSQEGSTRGVKFRFELISSGKLIASRDFGEGSAEFKVSEEGAYEIKVLLRGGLSEKDYDGVKSIKFTAEKEFQVPSGAKSEFSYSRTLKNGMSGEDVKTLQTALKTLGFFNYGSITNYFGPVTELALRTFQASQGLTVNGVLDQMTAEKINSELIRVKQQSQAPQQSQAKGSFKPTRTLKFGIMGEDVKELQGILKKLGHFNYPYITNYFGGVTRASVMDFQRKNGLVVDGLVGPKTVEKINSLVK